MNANCVWPAEAPRQLDLTNGADRHHLIVDTELIEDLVDRYRFHVPNDQAAREQRLIDVVARTHSVGISDVARARDRIPEKGLDLSVNVPVTVFFVFTVLGVTRRIERRFSTKPCRSMERRIKNRAVLYEYLRESGATGGPEPTVFAGQLVDLRR